VSQRARVMPVGAALVECGKLNTWAVTCFCAGLVSLELLRSLDGVRLFFLRLCWMRFQSVQIRKTSEKAKGMTNRMRKSRTSIGLLFDAFPGR
jgi:hypothetical protein